MNSTFSLRSLLSIVACAALTSTGCYAAPELADEPDGVDDAHPSVGTAVQAITSLNNRQAELCVTASSDNNSGTSHDITLDYTGERLWSCTITGGIESGETRCCTATNDVYNISYTPAFYVSVGSGGTDGLQFTAISYRTRDSSTRTIERWTTDSSVKGGGCTLGIFDCNNSWVDSDGNGGCHRAALNVGTSTMRCYESSGYYNF